MNQSTSCCLHPGGPHRRFTGSVALLALSLFASCPALAEPREEAKERFDRASALVVEQDYEKALIEFQRAYELQPDFRVLFNIGQTYVALGRAVEAIEVLNRYLSAGGDAIAPEQRALAERTIDDQLAYVGEIAVTVHPSGALVTVDGREAGRSPLAAPVRVSIGQHRIVVVADGYERAEQSITVAGRDRKALEVHLVPIAKAVSRGAPPPVREPNSSPAEPRRSPTLAYALGGAGIALAGVGTAFGIMALGDNRDVKRLCPGGQNCSEEALEAEKTRNRNAWIANVGVGLGLVGIGTAAVLLIAGRGHEKAEQREGRRFDFRFDVAGEHAGASVAGTF